jgi:hypothetical protein
MPHRGNSGRARLAARSLLVAVRDDIARRIDSLLADDLE